LFAYKFGWDIEYILGLSPSQVSAIQDGLVYILKQENGTKDEEEFEENPEIQREKLKDIQKKLGKGNIK